MSRKSRKKKLSLPVRTRVTDSVPPVEPPIAPTAALSPQPKVKINAMDLFRTMDKSSKELAAKRTADGFENFLSRVGLNNDNALSDSTYEFNLITRNRILLEAAYRGSWVAGAVVDSVAEDMTRAGIDVTTNEDQELKKFEAAYTRLQIWQSIQSVIKWGRLYGGALGVLQIRGQLLSTPLDVDTVGKDQFLGIVPYDRWQLNPVLTDVIEEGPNMGLPEYYDIVTSASYMEPGPNTRTGQVRVHHSRCIRFTGIELPFFQAITEMMWGESILERLWDRLIAFDNATLSSGQLIDRANLRTVGIEGFREIVAAGGEAMQGLTAMFEMMRLMQVNEGLTLLDKNDTFASTSYSFAGLSDMLLQFGQQLSGSSNIPLVRLFGQSPAGLGATGESELRMYYDGINAQQNAKLREPIDTVNKVLWRSTFGSAPPTDLEFTFTPLWQMSAIDKATIAKSNTETVLGAHENGLVPAGTALKELRGMSGDTGLFSNISDEDITEAEAEPAPLPDMADPAMEKPKTPVPSLDSTWYRRLGAWVSPK